ncbi:putative membrane protein [Kitasatospora gansuensis]|uniref:Putative membrane protein n=1 Tax=Kitasatospora gansuensis TaxID=258050 RepID=A0A7W7WKJ0_9ACTN|nr:DUF3040 domain-containing protein [Kitasatospora gansuensis]MBB4950476.1 putative membrane protein [Kitasatospora gansuensis]
MDGPALSWRERRILAEIETDLVAADTRLARELGSMRRGRLRWPYALLRAVARIPAGVVTVAVAVSLALVVIAAQLRTVSALVSVGVVVAATLLVLFARPLSRLVARRRGR